MTLEYMTTKLESLRERYVCFDELYETAASPTTDTHKPLRVRQKHGKSILGYFTCVCHIFIYITLLNYGT